jgi:hypothetical protein
VGSVAHRSPIIIGLIARDGLEPTRWLEREVGRIFQEQFPVVGLTAIRGDVDVAFAELLHDLREPCIVIREAARSSAVRHDVEMRIANRASTLVTLVESSFERYVVEQSDLIVVVTNDRFPEGEADLERMLARAVLRGGSVLVLDVENERCFAFR